MHHQLVGAPYVLVITMIITFPAYHAVDEAKKRLEKAGFVALKVRIWLNVSLSPLFFFLTCPPAENGGKVRPAIDSLGGSGSLQILRYHV